MGRMWEHSNTIERDANDERAEGALAYFFLGGTTTPFAVYSDAAESTPHTHPVEADGNGRWPNIFIPFTASYDVKVITAGGTQLYYPRLIPNPDPVTSTPDSVPEEERIKTGHVHWEPVDATKTGFVRLNGRTIGSAASGGTERANADTEDLFTYLWNNLTDTQAPVSTGRGGSAAADFAANKTITLLDGRSGTLVGLDTMGNSAASRLGSAPFTNGSSSTPGSLLGENTHTLSTAELSSHTHTIAITSDPQALTNTGTESANHSHTYSGTTSSNATSISASVAIGSGAAGGGAVPGNVGATSVSITDPTHAHTYSGTTSIESAPHTHVMGDHTHLVSGTSASTGSGTAHNIVSYGTLGTFYQKL